MKCLVFSDSHGSSYGMLKALALHPDAEVVFFLGDGLSDADSVEYSDRISGHMRAWLQ
jgi:predicted phosphodiesterase